MLNQESFFNLLKLIVSPQLTPGKYKRYVISCSGGLDSMVLLHLMSVLPEHFFSNGKKLLAIYVNHNLSPHALKWGQFCQTLCSSYHIPLHILSVNAQPKARQSPEATARDARYAAITSVLQNSDCLLTAHHKNDQIETLFLQLLRGSGPKGLAAMSACRKHQHFDLIRPLLSFSRIEIKNYALKHQLQWIEDESNEDQKFKRNFLRKSILPQLKQQWPGLEASLYRVSQLQQEASEIIEQVASEDLANCELDLEAEKKVNPFFIEPMLDIKKLHLMSSARIKNCLQFWLRKNKVAALTSRLLEQFLDEFIHKKPASKTQLSWQVQDQLFYLRHYENKIFLSLQGFFKPKDKGQDLFWDYQKYNTINLGDTQLQVNFYQGLENSLKLNNKNSLLALDKVLNPVKLMFRQGGECFKKNKNSQHFSLKKWFQEQSVPPWLRDKIVLIYVADELIQVGNTLVNQYYKAQKSQTAMIITSIFSLEGGTKAALPDE